MKKSDIRIVVLQRGWIVVGRYSEKGGRGYIDNGSVIRKWGTEKGLGQLVDGPILSGQYAPTVLDKCSGQIHFLLDKTILLIKCNAKGWEAVC